MAQWTRRDPAESRFMIVLEQVGKLGYILESRTEVHYIQAEPTTTVPKNKLRLSALEVLLVHVLQ